MRVSATAKFVGTSARKIGLAAEIIRGQHATVATMLLARTPKRAADPVSEVLKSATANATNNHGMKKAELFVAEVLVGPGPTIKRWQPRARGASYKIRKRTSHITVILSDELAVNALSKQKPEAPRPKTEVAPEAKMAPSVKPTTKPATSKAKSKTKGKA